MKPARVLAVAAVLAMTANAIAVPTTVRVAELTVEVDPGTNQCPLDEKADEAGRISITQQREANKNRNEVLTIFVPCSKLEAFRVGEPLRITSTGCPPQGRFRAVHGTAHAVCGWKHHVRNGRGHGTNDGEWLDPAVHALRERRRFRVGSAYRANQAATTKSLEHCGAIARACLKPAPRYG